MNDPVTAASTAASAASTVANRDHKTPWPPQEDEEGDDE